jgi:hypothetical protein
MDAVSASLPAIGEGQGDFESLRVGEAAPGAVAPAPPPRAEQPGAIAAHTAAAATMAAIAAGPGMMRLR